MGIPLYTQKPPGFAEEKLAHPDGIPRFLKMTCKLWVETQEELERKVEFLKNEDAKLKKFGVKI